MAAGLSLNRKNIEELRLRLNGQATLSEDDLIPKIYLDMRLPLEHITFNLVEELKLLEPYGKGNPKPLFGEKDIPVMRAFKIGKNQNTLKLIIKMKNEKTIEGLYFGDVEEFERVMAEKHGNEEVIKMYKGIDNSIKLDIAYSPSINEYMGNKSLQVIIYNYR